LRRATAALLAGLFALAPGLRAAAASSKARVAVVVLPYTALAGDSVPEASRARLAELLAQELRGREALKVVELPPRAPARPQKDAGAEARALLGKAAGLGKRGMHAQAAAALQRAIARLAAQPLSLDEAGGQLLCDAVLQLAVERTLAGDDEGGDKALAQLVRLAPGRELAAADYPPAFVQQLEAVRKRILGEPRGSLRILAPDGPGESRVILDGRALLAAPVLIKIVVPGEHFVRVERGLAAWAEKVIAIAGAETKVAPQPGAIGPAVELSGALLQDEFERAAAIASKLAREAGAQAAVFGAVLRSGDRLSVRSFLVRSDRAVALSTISANVELLGAAVELARLADEVQARILGPLDGESSASVSLATAAPAVIPEVQGAPLPPPSEMEPALAPLVSETPPPPPPPAERRVAMPGAPVSAPHAPAPAPPLADTGLVAAAPKAAPAEPPSRALVIPREPTPDDADAPPQVAKPRQAPAPEKRIAALEPGAVKTVREPPAEKKNHALLWVLAGAVLVGGLAAGGYYLYQQGQTPTTSTITATWGH
jgi:hypothetical protein